MKNRIPAICNKVLALTAEEFAEIEERAQAQLDYISPLKLATQARYNALGTHNMTVLAKLRELRDVIQAGEDLAKK